MTNETTAPSGTESRILDQIVAEITGVIAKMDEGDIERAMPLIGKTAACTPPAKAAPASRRAALPCA